MFLVAVADTAVLPTAQAVDLLILTQAAAAPGSSWQLLFFAVTGSTLGGMLLYWMARTGGGWAVRKGVSEEKLVRVRAKIERWDALALILPTAIPLPFAPMKIFIVGAGVLRLNAIRAAAALAFARLLRYGFLILLGVYFGQAAWEAIRGNGWVVALAIVAAAAAWTYLRGRRRKNSATKPAPPVSRQT